MTCPMLAGVLVVLAQTLADSAQAQPQPSASADPGPTGRGVAVFNIRQFGAVGDCTRLDTAAIQAAIDACGKNAGGTVLVPAGRYLIGTLLMKSNVTLHLAPTAILLGTPDIKQYAIGIERCGFVNESQIDKCLIYAADAENVAITGQGSIDGQGASFPATTPDGKRGERPMLIRFFRCRAVSFDGVTLKSAGSWCSHFRECSDVRVRGVTIHNRVNGNNDGIDLMSTEKVRISDCTIICGDDAICFQDMSDDHPVQDIVITNCIFSTRWAAIRSGGAHRGGIRHVAMSNCVIYDTYGGGIKLQISGNGLMEDMTFSNIVMKNVSTPISLRFGNCHYNNEQRDESHPWGGMRNILFSNIRASVIDQVGLKKAVPELYPGEERQCISICGIPGHPVEGVTLSDIRVTFPGGGTKEDAAKRDMPELADQYPEYFMWGVLPAYALYARHVRGLALNNVSFDLAGQDLRPALVCDDVADLDISGFRAMADKEVESVIRLRATRQAFLCGCRPLNDVAMFLRVEGKASRDITLRNNDLHRCRQVVDTADGANARSVDASGQSVKP
jgi:hypothetical protein